MANYEFNTPEGQTIARELLIAYLNTGTDAAPVLSAIGRRVENSGEEYDWGEDTVQDVLGRTYGTMKKPVVTQSFDAMPLDSGDSAAALIHRLAVIEQNAQALSSMDMVIGHWYLSAEGQELAHFAERYDSCMVRPTGLGGEGGGNIEMPIDVTYGGTRTLGTVTKGENGVVSFTPEA